MSNVYQFNANVIDDDFILDQASDWLAKMDRGLNNEETISFQKWLHACPKNMATMFEVAKMWDKMDEVARLSDIFPEAKIKQSKRPVWIGAIAASIVIAFTFTFLMPVYKVDVFSSSQPQVAALERLTFQTDVGESNTILLADKSKLLLNTNSRVNINYTTTARVIELQRGEIHIDVAHDKSRPLSILAGGQVIQAVGTAFNVQVKADKVELIVTNGKVLVKEKSIAEFNTLIETNNTKLVDNVTSVSKDEKIELRLGVDSQEYVVPVDSLEIATKLSWQKGKLIFKGESLIQALKEISRYTKVQFQLEDNDYIKQVKVAGVFKTGDVTGLLSVLEKNFSISHEQISEHKIKLSYQTL